MSRATCAIHKCPAPAEGDGLCREHRARVLKLAALPADSAAPPFEAPEKTCSVPDCGAVYYANDLCKRHDAQVRRHGRLTPEKENGARQQRYRPAEARKKAPLTQSETRVLEVVSATLEPITARLLARAVWPERHEKGLVVASGAMLARLERRGLLLRIDREGEERRYLPVEDVPTGRSRDGATVLEPRETEKSSQARARELGRALSAIRRRKGIEASEVAKAIGVSAGYLHCLECGIRLPSDRALIAWAKKLGVSPERCSFLAGKLGEAPARLFRESGLAARIAHTLVGLTQEQLQSVLAFVGDLERREEQDGQRASVRENGFGRQSPTNSQPGRPMAFSAEELKRASRAKTLSQAARLLGVGRHATKDALTRANLPLPRRIPFAATVAPWLVQAVVEDYRAHKIGLVEAGRRLGCSRATARSILGDAGVTLHEPGPAGHVKNGRRRRVTRGSSPE